ncbi:SusC/RagA family TonB-linked outer membrane protein [Arcticibacter sp.]|uniref:SusC/RagA family TonB-linked outer membrane protein n=1 Tax=Arcticibacter sp. TaxID=1872630 RepID=UPI00388FBAE0
MKFNTRSSYSVRFLCVLLLALSTPLLLKSQDNPKPLINSTLQGTILDAKTKEPLIGVSIQLKGTTHSSYTDSKGRFQFITGQKFPYNIIISYIGYEKKELTVNGSPVEVLLKEDIKTLNEVVVVGYGTQSKRSVIGAVSTIKTSEIANQPSASFDQQIQGRAAGVQVGSNTGVPGDGLFFRIRGTTSINASSDPLYIIDGVFINNQSLQKITTQGQSNNPLADINPSDIESISILKDAEATAIYGARAANGVVLITTKRGTYNSRPKISLNIYQGASWAPKLWDLLTGPEHASIINEAWANDGKPFATRPFRPVSEGGRGLPEEQQTYDRLNDVFRTGRLQNYDLSVSGGNDKTRYYIGGGYSAQDATLKTNDYSRASFKINLDQTINSFLKVGTSNTLARSQRANARVGDGPQGGILQAALHTPTYLPKFNADGTYAKWAGFDNLDVLINNTDMQSVSTRYIGNVYGEAEIAKGLKFRSSWSLDYNNYDEYEYWNSLTNRGSANKGLAASSISQNLIWSSEQTLTYRNTFSQDHTIGVLLGNSVQGNTAKQTFAQGTNFPSDDLKQIASAATTISSSNLAENKLSSFFTRVDYNYAGKYFLEASLRADGSSRFGADKKWGYFPSAGLSWRVKEESFLVNSQTISDLKIRASIGLTGNQNGIDNYAALGLWQGGYNYLDNPGSIPVQLANANLGWESTRQTNLGVDLGLFKDRLGIEFNVYHKYTEDLLLNDPLAPSTGFSSITKNTGEISNKGIELGINSTNIAGGHFKWQTNLNLGRNINKIEKLPTPIDASYNTIRMIEGYPLYSFFVYKQLYVDPQTGDAVYEDLNQDGQLTVADKQVVGNASPKLFGGLNNAFSFKGIDLSVFFNFSYGNKIYNNNRFFLESGGTRDDRRAINKNQLNRWQKPGDITDVPRVTTQGTNYTLSPSSRFVEDGSFLRLSTVNLGYTLPKHLSSKVNASTIRFYVTGTNLALWTKYSGPDPEINVTSNPLVQGYDLGTPPVPRTIQLGLNVTL